MLMAVKNQLRVILLSIKYNIVRAMTNKVTFISNVVFMMLNNATFIVQWIILFNLKDNIAGYYFKDTMVIWAFASATYGISHLLFRGSYSIPKLIVEGKLDAFLVQPKNVLLSILTSETEISAIGDLLYGYVLFIIFEHNIFNILLFLLLSFTGGLILTAFNVIVASITFYFVRGESLSNMLTGAMTHVATYPDTIFDKGIRILFYTILPISYAIFMPVNIIREFNLLSFMIVIMVTIVIVTLAFIVFNRGLKSYGSSNLMSARV